MKVNKIHDRTVWKKKVIKLTQNGKCTVRYDHSWPADTCYNIDLFHLNCGGWHFKRLFNFLYLCCIIMFRWFNKQLGIHNLWNLWCKQNIIYDWISPFNKPQFLWFILTQQSIRESKYGKFGHLHIFTFPIENYMYIKHVIKRDLKFLQEKLNENKYFNCTVIMR